jgi:hypothetical protein
MDSDEHSKYASRARMATMMNRPFPLPHCVLDVACWAPGTLNPGVAPS